VAATVLRPAPTFDMRDGPNRERACNTKVGRSWFLNKCRAQSVGWRRGCVAAAIRAEWAARLRGDEIRPYGWDGRAYVGRGVAAALRRRRSGSVRARVGRHVVRVQGLEAIVNEVKAADFVCECGGFDGVVR